MKAAKHGHIEVVKFLIEEGKANIHARNKVSDQLHFPAKFDNMYNLAKAGVDALIVASKYNCVAVVRYLLSSKANANVSSYVSRYLVIFIVIF